MDLNLYAFASGSDPEIRMWHENPNSPKLDNYSHDQLWYLTIFYCLLRSQAITFHYLIEN